MQIYFTNNNNKEILNKDHTVNSKKEKNLNDDSLSLMQTIRSRHSRDANNPYSRGNQKRHRNRKLQKKKSSYFNPNDRKFRHLANQIQKVNAIGVRTKSLYIHKAMSQIRENKWE